MKTNTVVSVLRATRSRMEVSGLTQLGPYEMVALNVSAYELKDNILRSMALVTAKGLIHNDVVMIKLNSNIISSLKNAHHYFKEQPSSKEWEIKDISQEFYADSKITESMPEEVKPFADMDWLQKQIEEISKDGK